VKWLTDVVWLIALFVLVMLFVRGLVFRLRMPPIGKEEWKQVLRLIGWAVVVIIVIIVGIVAFEYWRLGDKGRFALQYHISPDVVVVEPRPHGCDFDDPPLGNKHCHFEKEVDVERVCPEASCQVTGVYVTWYKVND
jgi:hypothetical protein